MSDPAPAVAAAVNRLWAAISDRRDELVATVADLVRIPSQLGEEAAVQAHVADHLRASGLAAESWDIDERVTTLPNAGDSGVPFAGRPNVTGRLPGGGGGRSLILNGHVDVVSPEPLDLWRHDPWGATIVGDRLYGRGACDMKSGVAINLFLARLLRDLDITLSGDLTVHSVIEEECTGNGALAASHRDHADAALITEPEGMSFLFAHLGVIWFRVRVTGKTWHVAEARKGVNAIVKMMPVMRALLDLDERMNLTVHPVWREAGIEHPINLNLGVIAGGDWPSTVPGECELRCRVSLYPEQTVAAVRAEIEAAVAGAAAADDWLRQHPPLVSYDGFGSAGSIVGRDEPSIRLLGHWHERVTGTAMPFRVGTAITDQRYYNFAGVPCGCYGASGGGAHGADEWLDLASLVPTTRVIGAFLLDWCGVAG